MDVGFVAGGLKMDGNSLVSASSISAKKVGGGTQRKLPCPYGNSAPLLIDQA